MKRAKDKEDRVRETSLERLVVKGILYNISNDWLWGGGVNCELCNIDLSGYCEVKVGGLAEALNT